MISLLISLAVLVVGFFVYGKVTEKVFAPDDRQTPAIAINDGVDCVPMKTWKAFLIQLLNIAGTGPIFGALMGAVFGPVVFLWIMFGSILGGAVHDYMSGMISSRHKGASIAAFPAAFMTAVSVTYLMISEEGFSINQTISYIIGISAAVALFIVYLVFLIRNSKASRTNQIKQ